MARPKAKLSVEEREILVAHVAGELQPVADEAEEVERLRAYAEATMRKDARINIRLSKRDLRMLQAKAIEEGMPYQTLVGSVLHKYVEGRLREV